MATPLWYASQYGNLDVVTFLKGMEYLEECQHEEKDNLDDHADIRQVLRVLIHVSDPTLQIWLHPIIEAYCI